MAGQNPELEDLVGDAVEQGLATVYTSLPGKIVAYDSAKQSASVQSLVVRAHKNQAGDDEWHKPPVLQAVPVMFLGSATGRITWPVAVGDKCLLLFASSDIGHWKMFGDEVDIPFGRGTFKDVIAIVGLHSLNKPPTTAPTDAVVIHGNTRLGDPAATDDKYRVATRDTLDEFMTVLGGVTDTAGACAALHTALVSAGWPTNFVAAKVRAK